MLWWCAPACCRESCEGGAGDEVITVKTHRVQEDVDVPVLRRLSNNRTSFHKIGVPGVALVDGAGAPEILKAVSEWPLLVSKKEEKALDALYDQLAPHEEDLARTFLVHGEPLNSCFLRFLRNNELNVSSTMKALRADWAWRQSMRVDHIAESRTEDIAKCDRELIMGYFPTWHQGFDKSGRPLIITHFGRFRWPPILKQTTVEGLLQNHIQNSERIARIIGQQALRLNTDISSVLTIVDAEDWDAANLRNFKSMQYAKGMADIDEAHFPERLGQMFVINAPNVVYRFWQLLQYALPEKTRRKINIYAGRDTWLPDLLAMIDADQLPPEYGGCGVSRCEEGIPFMPLRPEASADTVVAESSQQTTAAGPEAAPQASE